MIAYFLKSFICLALLLAFYHLVLEREKMHQFNRFYLLGSILFSFIAPLYKIYIEVAQTIVEDTQPLALNYPIPTKITEPIQETNYMQYALFVYLIISLILTIRFIKNLVSLYLKTKQHEKIKKGKAILVLVNDLISPHTFWNYIFINKEEYYSNKIETELYTHELTHALQKHTFDILLIEVLQIVFWINPTYILLKKAIKLNHEFLADSNVITKHKNTSEYQYLLLNRAAWNNEYYLASNLNYLLTKKRLLMMTKQSSRTKILFKKLAVIPVLAGFTFLFAERVEAENPEIKFIDSEIIEKQKNEKKPEEALKGIKEKLKNANSLELSINQKDTLIGKLPNGETIKVWETNDSIPKHRRVINRHKGTFIYTDKNGKVVSKKISELTDEEKKMIPPPPPPVGLIKKTVTKNLLDKLKNPKKYAVWIDGKAVNNNVLNNYKPSDFYNYMESFVHKNARSKRFPQEYQYQLNTKKHIDKRRKHLPPPPPPKKSKEIKPVKIEVKEKPKTGFINLKNQKIYYVKNEKGANYYNRWGQQVTEKGQVISKEDKFKKSNTIIIGSSTTDKNGQEKGWKHIGNQTLYYIKTKKGITYYNRWGQQVTKEGKVINPEQTASDNVIPGQNITKVYKDNKVVTRFKNTNLPPPPPKANFPEVKKGENSNIPKPKTSQVKTKNNWVVGDEVHVVEDINTETGAIYKRKDIIKKPTSNEHTEFIKLDENLKKIYFIEDKRTTKKEFYNLLKNNKEYHIGSSYTDKEKSAINMYISKSENKIIALMKKGY